MMSARDVSPSCLTPEALKAFLEGRDAPMPRRDIVEHIALCAGCRQRLAGVTASLPPKPRVSRAGVVLVAIVAIAIAAIRFRARLVSHPRGIEALVASSERIEHRHYEGRLSGGFPHRPVVAVKRSGQTVADPTTILRLRRAQFENAEDLHAGAVADLLLRTPDAAVDKLERILRATTGQEDLLDAIHRAPNPALLSDLAVAYVERAKSGEDPRDRLLALETAERAWRMRANLEAAWNRAVALQHCGLRQAARAAWQQYLTLDGQSEWADEARLRLRLLEDSTRGWSRDELVRAMHGAKDARLRKLVEEDPEQFRMIAEEVLLPDAAAQLPLRGNQWREVRAVARVLVSRGEGLLEETLDALERADERSLRTAASALDHYRRGRASMKANELKAALASFDAALEGLIATRNPFAARAAIYRSTMLIYDGKAEAGVRRVDEAIRSMNVERWPLVAAQVHWVHGLGLATDGKPGAALRAYEEASRFAAETRENASVAGIEQVVADALRDIGNPREAWRHHLAAAGALDEAVRYERKILVLLGMVRAASRERYRFVPALVLEQVQRLARTANDPLYLSSALIISVELAQENGDVAAAESFLNEAERTWAQLSDSGMQLRVRADIDTARFRAMAAAGREPDVDSLTRALAVFEDIELRTRLAEMHHLRGRAHLRRGDRAAARDDLRQGLAELDRQRVGLTIDEKRTQAAVASALVDEWVLLELDGGDVEAAFDVAESARARVLLERVTGTASNTNTVSSWRDIRPRLSADTVLIAFSLLRDRLVIWRATREGLAARAVRVDPLQLRASIQRLRSAIASEDASFAKQSATLHAWLSADVRPGETVVFIPDSELFDVPFAALRDRASGRYLVEQISFALAPSASLAVLPERKSRDAASSLVMGVSRPAGMDALSGVEREVTTVASRLENALVLRDDAVTVAAFAANASSSTTIHFAGHAISHSAQPARSALLLSSEDGTLTAGRVSAMQLDGVELVVLAACRTAEGTSDAEAPLTMATAFLTAGASTVVATTMDVDDAAATRLFDAFYSNHRSGIAASDALQRAQLELLRDPRYSAPRHWAPFTVFGTSLASHAN